LKIKQTNNVKNLIIIFATSWSGWSESFL